jgi:hypothetical protein
MLDRGAARPSTAPGPGPRAGRCAAPAPRTANARRDPGPIVGSLRPLGWGGVHDASRPGGSGAGTARRVPSTGILRPDATRVQPWVLLGTQGWPRAPTFSRMSGSSEGDPEGGEGSGGVAGVVTEGGGEVDGPGAAEHAADEVAQAGHVCGPVPVLTWEASSAKVTSRTWCRPFSRLALHRGPAGVVLPFDGAPVTFGLQHSRACPLPLAPSGAGVVEPPS